MLFDDSATRDILQNQTYGWTYSVSYTDQGDEDLRRRQKAHLEEVRRNTQGPESGCLHNSCPECIGTWVKRDGTACVHMISCPCPRCSPRC